MPPQILLTSPNGRQLALATGLVFSLLMGVALWTQSRLGGQLLPHAFCISANRTLLRLHLVSGALIAVAYLLIPWAMLRFVRQRQDVPFGWIAWVFGAFIVACGLTHALDIWTLYEPVYWYAGVAKAFTAAVSLGTAFLIYRLTPVALAMPSAQQLRDANRALQEEVQRRRQAECELVRAKSELEDMLREASVEARRSAAVLHRFFEEAPLGLALMDARLDVVRSNGRLADITGEAQAPQADRPRLPAAVVQAACEAQSTGAGRDGIEVSVGAGAAPRVLKCSVFPIQVDAGEKLVGAVLEDVTAERALARERSDALEAAREADQRKTEFLALLAHELRNPLAPVRTGATLLKHLTHADDERTRKVIATIERQVAHMSRLVEDLLDVSRIERGQIRHQPIETDLADIVRQVCHDYEASFRAVGSTLRVEVEEALPVRGDPVRLAQCVGNYLHNAVKFAPASPVRVTARIDHATREAVVSVADAGEGIAPELLARLFQPFVQGEREPGRSKGGLGLGLTLARRLVEMHGGRVSVASAGPGQGATFELRIPLLDDAGG